MNTRLIKAFSHLVSIDSPTGEEKKVAEEIITILSKLHIKIRTDDYGNVIGYVEGSGDPLFLNAHLDTVEPGRGIKAVLEKGVLKSKGNTILGGDDKAGVAAILEAITVLKEKKIAHRPLELVFTLSEEIGNLGAVNLDYSLLSSQEGYCFDSAHQVGSIITAAPFYSRFDMTILGRSAHASRPEQAINALSILGNILGQVSLGRTDEETLINIGRIAGGDVRNTIPGEMTIQGEVRSFNEAKLEAMVRFIQETATQAAEKLGGRIEIEVVRENGGYRFSEELPLIQRTIGIMKTLGIKPHCQITYGCADSNIFRDHGLTILNLGNGVEKPHTTEEQITVKDLELLTKLIIELVKVN